MRRRIARTPSDFPVNPHDELRRLERLAELLDTRFAIPGTGIRFGLDALVGLIPGIGDSATLIAGAYIIARAERLGAPRRILGRMTANVLLDWLAGMVPVLGDIFDIGYRANRRNVGLLRRYIETAHPDRDRSRLYQAK